MDDLFEVVKSRYGELCEAGYTVAFCFEGEHRFFRSLYKDATCIEMNNELVRIVGTDHTSWISAFSLDEIITSLIDISNNSRSFVESIEINTLDAAIVEVIKVVVQANLSTIYGHIAKNMLMDKFDKSTRNN